MGLDSVELLVSFEKYFSISVPDLEAEKIRSVQNMMDSVSIHRRIESTSVKLKMDVLEKLKQEIQMSDEEKIYLKHHPSEKNFWIELEKRLELKIPLPYWNSESNNRFSGIFKWLKYKPDYDWKDITVIRLAEVICFSNYKKLISPSAIENQFEIYVAIAGITQELCGIDFFEILPEKTFVGDFGID